MQTSIATTQRLPVPMTRFFCVFVAIGAIYVIGMRVYVAANAPLWLDETWSAMIATRAEWPEFWREAWLDCNPPLYYLFLTGWVSLFGDSNLTLRLPSMIFVVAAASVPIIWRPSGLNRTGAWTFAALILLWPQGLGIMLDARGYGLMLLLSTLSCLVVNTLLERMTLPSASAWVALDTMMFLTHYYAAVLIVAQALVLFWRYRADLFAMWPAALIAIPGFAWFVYHLPRLKSYARPDVAWQSLTDAESAFGHLAYVFGAWNGISLGVIAGFVIIVYGWRQKTDGATAPVSADRNLALVAATAAIAFILAIMIGTLQASLIDRYLVPLVPPTMLGLTLITQRGERQALAGSVLAIIFLLPGLNARQAENFAEDRAMYGYEDGSAFIRAHRPDKLIFLWDHPAAKILDPHSLAGMGGYFMERAGVNIPVVPLVVPNVVDPNVILRSALKGERTAVIWLYNRSDQTAARNHAPTFEDDPAWTCHDRGEGAAQIFRLGAVACVKKWEKAGD